MHQSRIIVLLLLQSYGRHTRHIRCSRPRAFDTRRTLLGSPRPTPRTRDWFTHWFLEMRESRRQFVRVRAMSLERSPIRHADASGEEEVQAD